jgi:hypothetical protein
VVNLSGRGPSDSDMTVRKTRSKKRASAKKNDKIGAAAQRSTTNPRKRDKPLRTVAETRGLLQRDAVVTAERDVVSDSGSSSTIIDQQFSVWSVMMSMSPLPFILQQQAVVAKLIMGFLLPTSRPADEGKEK